MKTIHKSAKLANVCYDIRGPIMDRARQMEEEGHKIIKLNIGNLAVFGFDAPEEIQQDMIRNLPNSAGYSDSKGIFGARKAVMHETQKQGIKGVTLEDIYLGNGASELIVMATNALLERKGEATLLVTTQGFGDALRIAYQNRPRIFDRHIQLPELLYSAVVEAHERVGAHGETLQPLDELLLKKELETQYEQGLRSVSIVFLHGYRYTAHEQAAKRLAQAVGFTRSAPRTRPAL